MYHFPLLTRSHPITDADLETSCILYGEGYYKLQLRGDRIHYLNHTVEPELCPVYLPEGCISKAIPLSGNVIYRKNGGYWYFSPNYRVLDLQRPGDRIDAIFFHERKPLLTWLRFLGTDDPTMETPSAECLFYTIEEGCACVFGAQMFAERIHIPAQINGLPIKHVRLPKNQIGKNVHELVVAEGVESLLFSFDLPHLQTIEIPDSVHLLAPPIGIQNTPWYRSQPDGDVYLHGHYCGTKRKEDPHEQHILDP